MTPEGEMVGYHGCEFLAADPLRRDSDGAFLVGITLSATADGAALDLSLSVEDAEKLALALAALCHDLRPLCGR